jgi:hypothetical protein
MPPPKEEAHAHQFQDVRLATPEPYRCRRWVLTFCPAATGRVAQRAWIRQRAALRVRCVRYLPVRVTLAVTDWVSPLEDLAVKVAWKVPLLIDLSTTKVALVS